LRIEDTYASPLFQDKNLRRARKTREIKRLGKSRADPSQSDLFGHISHSDLQGELRRKPAGIASLQSYLINIVAIRIRRGLEIKRGLRPDRARRDIHIETGLVAA